MQTARAWRWVARVEDLERVDLDEAVPLVRPADDERRRRFADVLAWYDWRPANGDRTSMGGRPPDVRDGDVVAAGPREAPVAAMLAALLDRRLVAVDDEAAVERHLSGCGGRSALVVAGASRMTAACLERLAAAAQAGGATLGVVTGRDDAGLTFSAAKIAAAQLPFAEPDLLLDGLGGTFTDDRDTRPLEADVASALGREWRVVTCLAHGEGAHARLGPLVVCGLHERNERWLDGTPVPGGCVLGGRCKRAPSRAVRQLMDVRMRAFVLLSCNGLSLAGQLYPSSVSLALAAAESHPAATVSATRRVALDSSAVNLVHAALTRGAPIGAVARLLNERASPGQASYVVAGDPTWVPVRAVAEGGRAAGSGSSTATTVGGDRAAELERLAGRLPWAAGLERALASGSAGLRTVALMSARRRLEARTWLALRELGVHERSGVPSAALGELVAGVRADAAAWDETLAQLLAKGGLDASFADLLHFFSFPARTHPTAPCARCGTLAELTTLRGRPPGIADRVLVGCPVCGPLEEHAQGEPAVALGGPVAARPGESIELTLHVHGAERGHGRVWLVGELSDKARDGSLWRTCVNVDAAARSLALTVAVPHDASPDLQTARVARIGEVSVAFARWRVAIG